MTLPSVGPRAHKAKPAKPRKDFPLYAHGSGQWAKKIKGKTHFFGKWDDPVAAETKWLRECEALINGQDPNEVRNGETVGWMVNAFLDFKLDAAERGSITMRAYKDYKLHCVRVSDFFSRGRSLESVRPTDFDRYRSALPSTWAPTTVNNHLRHVRALWEWANDRELTDRPIKFKGGLVMASKDKVRKHIASKPEKTFTAAEIKALLAVASVQLKAAILLGINCAYGIADCGLLEVDMIDFDRCWLKQHRNKTGVARGAWLWPETVKALKAAIKDRYHTDDPELSRLIFITKQRRPWYVDGGNSHPASIAFRKAKLAAGCHEPGVAFYALRHTFETIAGDTGDQIAVNTVMGHHDNSIQANYRHGISDDRIKAVCEAVRAWLYAKPKKQKATAR